MTNNIYQTHPYHLVTPSPWPLFTSFSLFSLAIFAVAYFQVTPFSPQGLQDISLLSIHTSWTVFNIPTRNFKSHGIIETDKYLQRLVNRFWKDVILDKNISNALVLLKGTLDGDLVRTFGEAVPIGNKDRVVLFNILNDYLSKGLDNYIGREISDLWLYYKEPSEGQLHQINLDKEKEKSKLNKNIVDIKKNTWPKTMNLYEWDDKLFFIMDRVASFSKRGLNYIFQLSDTGYRCLVVQLGVQRKLYEFKDELLNESEGKLTYGQVDLTSFTRTIFSKGEDDSFSKVKSIQVFKNGIRVSNIIKIKENPNMTIDYNKPVRNKTLKLSQTSTWQKRREYSTQINQAKSRENILTLDLECETYNEVMSVVSAAVYDGVINTTFYITDYEKPEDLIRDLLSYVISEKYCGYKCYAHNFSAFDGMFLFKSIAALKNNGYVVSVVYKEGKLIKVETKLFGTKIDKKGKEKKIKLRGITFLDSFLLLPDSLDKLAKCFNLKPKLGFNVLSINQSNLKLQHFRDTLLEYNKWDAELLYNIIISFKDTMRALFEIELGNCSTISSLAYKVFTKNYYFPMLKQERDNSVEPSTVHITSSELYHSILPAYRGGIVNVYRNHGFKLWHYDVNSLYPWVMKEFDYPIGNYEELHGDDIDIKNSMAIVLAEVETPKDLFTPFLLTRVNGKNMAPLGKWKDWYTSVELAYALKQGYKIKIIKGYIWRNKAKLFSRYVEDIYSMRLNYDKLDPRNRICKHLLNSLYGRFGMSPDILEHRVIRKDEEDSIKDIPVDVIPLGEVTLQAFKVRRNTRDSKLLPLEISTPIAIFITAHARVFMAEMIDKYKGHVFYVDTDSLMTDKELPKNMVGPEIGKFKLVDIIDEGVFLAPKVYGLSVDGDYIIKIKGLKKDGLHKRNHDEKSFELLKSLLAEGTSSKVRNQKWYRNISKANFTIKDSAYTIMATSNKRELVYENNILSHTIPYYIERL